VNEQLFKIPCQKLSQLIGLALEERDFSAVRSLEALYVEQCGAKKPTRAELAVDPLGARASVRLVSGTVFLTLINDQGNPVRIIAGTGNDGGLITIDSNGVVKVIPPEGPGDPEVRQATTSILQAMNVLNPVTAGTAA